MAATWPARAGRIGDGIGRIGPAGDIASSGSAAAATKPTSRDLAITCRAVERSFGICFEKRRRRAAAAQEESEPGLLHRRNATCGV